MWKTRRILWWMSLSRSQAGVVVPAQIGAVQKTPVNMMGKLGFNITGVGQKSENKMPALSEAIAEE